jgi:hypothetical protein
MSTNSSITVKTSDNKYLSIYCHWDGYLSGVGATLIEHYYEQSLVEGLIGLGDISTLGACIKSTEAYGRDKGEDGSTEAWMYETYEDVLECNNREFNYLWDGTQWLCNNEEF